MCVCVVMGAPSCSCMSVHVRLLKHKLVCPPILTGTHYVREMSVGASAVGVSWFDTGVLEGLLASGVDVPAAAAWALASDTHTLTPPPEVRRFLEARLSHTVSVAGVERGNGSVAAWRAAATRSPVPVRVFLSPLWALMGEGEVATALQRFVGSAYCLTFPSCGHTQEVWPQDRRDAAASRSSPFAAPAVTAGLGVGLLWAVPLPHTLTHTLLSPWGDVVAWGPGAVVCVRSDGRGVLWTYTAPVALAGVVYVSALRHVVMSDRDGVLTGVHTHSGGRVWSLPVNVSVCAPLVIAPGGVLVVCGCDDAGSVLAIATPTMSVLWRVSLSAPLSLCAVALAESVYGVTISGRVVGVGEGGGVWAWEGAATGLAYASASVLAVWGPSGVTALHPGSGSVVWQANTSTPTAGCAVGPSVLVCASPTGLFGLSLTTGALLWSAPVCPLAGPPSVDASGTATAACGNGTIVCVSVTTGVLLWRAHTHSPGVSAAGVVIGADGRIYATVNDGVMAVGLSRHASQEVAP